VKITIRGVSIFVVAVLSLTALCVFGLLVSGRSDLYKYDVRADYSYDFQQVPHTSHILELKDGKAEMPGTDGTPVTAFLKVRLAPSFSGYFYQPKITVASSARKEEYLFEYGAGGIRYLNISDFLSGETTTLHVGAAFAELEEQQMQIVTFGESFDTGESLLVIAPHPDDAEIAAYGLYSDSENATVVTVTSGDSGKKKYDEVYEDTVEHYRKKGRLRVLDSITVPTLGGVPAENAVNLGYFDGTLTQMFQSKNQLISSVHSGLSDTQYYRRHNFSNLISHLPGTSRWESLVQDLEYLIQTVDPKVIVAPHPFLDRSLDHKITTIALLEALRNLQREDGRLFFYTNHHPASDLFPYGKSGDAVSLPPEFSADLMLDTVYSHPTDTSMQRDKVMALEAMHDLRPNTEWRDLGGLIKMAVKRILDVSVCGDINYYRRSVRSNELFFVVEMNEIYGKRLSVDAQHADNLQTLSAFRQRTSVLGGLCQ